MIQQKALFLENFALQAKQVFQILKIKGDVQQINVTLKTGLILTDIEIERMMVGFSSWTKGTTYTGTEKQLIGIISDQYVNGTVNIDILADEFVLPGEIAASPEFNTTYTAGLQIEANTAKPFVSATAAEYLSDYGVALNPTGNDSFVAPTTSTSSTSSTTTTTTSHS